MRGSSHLAVGLGTGLALATYLTQEPRAQLAVLTWCALGSILPDIDHPGSAIGRKLWILSYPVAWIFGHRGAVHSILLALAGWAAARLLGGSWAVGLMAGWTSHLVCDAMTIQGIPFGFSSKSLQVRFPGILRVVYGSRAETAVVQMYIMLSAVGTALWMIR